MQCILGCLTFCVVLVHLVELGHVVDRGVEVHEELLGEDVPGHVRVQVGVPAGGREHGGLFK